MKLLIFLLIVSPMVMAEELKYLICRPDKLIKPSYSSDQNTYIKYFHRDNDSDKEEYPSSPGPYWGDGDILSGPGIQIELTETAPTSSKKDPDDIWEFQSWNFFARERPHAYTHNGFSLDRQTLNLTHASSRYCIGNSSCYRKVETKCKVFLRSQYENNLNKAKINSAKRNQKILQAYEKRLQI